MEPRTASEIYELGMEALVAALGRADTEIFLRQIAHGAGPANPPAPEQKPPGDREAGKVATNPSPPLSEDQQHEKIRDLQDPTGQQSLL